MGFWSWLSDLTAPTTRKTVEINGEILPIANTASEFAQIIKQEKVCIIEVSLAYFTEQTDNLSNTLDSYGMEHFRCRFMPVARIFCGGCKAEISGHLKTLLVSSWIPGAELAIAGLRNQGSERACEKCGNTTGMYVIDGRESSGHIAELVNVPQTSPDPSAPAPHRTTARQVDCSTSARDSAVNAGITSQRNEAGADDQDAALTTFLNGFTSDPGLGQFLPRSPPPNDPNNFAGTQVGQVRDDNGLKMKFCWCPPGNFTMGSPRSETYGCVGVGVGEYQVQVTLSNGFWLQKHQVTQGQWQSVMGTSLEEERVKAGRARNYGVGATHPMYHLSHEDATEFCAKLTAQERQAGRLPSGWEYRLPTEAQWEYACRAGKPGTYCFGNMQTKLGEYAWFCDNSNDETHPVGEKKPNDFGLCDMHGNVWEWCRDWYQATLPGGTDPEVSQPVRQLEVRRGDPDAFRVFRGGCWNDSDMACRSAGRAEYTPSISFYCLGFRVAAVQH